MLPHRKILLISSIVLVIGSLSTTLGYALHLRSDGYRRRLEADVSALLGMKLSIGSVEPMSFSARRLSDIRMWLPSREVEVFRCARAVWRNESGDGYDGYSLDLERGWLLIGADEWEREDYEQMLRGGLGIDFVELGLRRVYLNDIDVLWRHPTFTLTVSGASGNVYFEDDGTGLAFLQADQLNDVRVNQPIGLTARFTPGGGLRIHEVILMAPEAPLAALKLDELLGGPVTEGEFAGRVSYRDTANGPTISIAGAIRNARLRQLTAPLPGGPYDGLVDIALDEAVFASNELKTLRFSGRLSQLKVGQLAAALGVSALGGNVDLRIHQANYEAGRIEYLSAAGHADDVSLEAVTRLFGRGVVTGKLRIEIHSLLVVDDRLQQAEATLTAVPPDDGPATFDRDFLKNVSLGLLGVDATRLLPSSVTQVEYTQLGLRLVLNRDELRVLGTHGFDGKTILTVKLFGHELPVIRQPDRVFHVEDPIALLRERLQEYDTEQLREWWYKWYR